MTWMVKISCFVFLIEMVMSQTTMSTEEAAKIKAKMIADCRNKYKDLTDVEYDDILVKRIGSKTNSGACFMACVLKGVSYIKPDDTMNEQALLERLERTKAQAPPEEYPKKIKILETCKNVKGSDECDVARKIVACIIEQKKLLGVTTRVW